jgi:hypothetical protein
MGCERPRIGATGRRATFYLRNRIKEPGIQANKFVQKFGLRLLTELYEIYNPMPYDGARDMEVELAIGLREAGYGVWQA